MQFTSPLRLVLFSGFLLLAASLLAAPAKDIYEIRVYHLKNDSEVTATDQYLKTALIPALHKAGIKEIGAFKPLSNDTAAVKLIYLYIPYTSFAAWTNVTALLKADSSYARSSRSFSNAPLNAVPFEHFESILLEAFYAHPNFRKPSLDVDPMAWIYELRSYESPTLHLSERKSEMFNSGGEIPLFEKLGFHSVFYAQVLAGSRMPNLMYMTVYSDTASRNAHWKAFGGSPEWKQMSTDPKWENAVSVSHIDSILMRRTAYSDM